MIFVSTACVKNKKISESVRILAEAGFINIELSGGSEYYPEFENDLVLLKDKYQLNFRCHNYFPPPRVPFVLNLASLDNSVLKASIENILSAIELSKKFGANKYGIHAGFYIDIKNSEIGNKISKRALFNREKSTETFYKSFRKIKEEATGIDIYLENNVLSSKNYKEYEGVNAFMLTSYKDYLEMKNNIDFKLLLDAAHLKVSCNSLNINFNDELNNMIEVSDYLHISENNALEDQNHPIEKNGEIFSLVNKTNISNKDITLEVYGEISDIRSSFNLIDGIQHAQ